MNGWLAGVGQLGPELGGEVARVGNAIAARLVTQCDRGPDATRAMDDREIRGELAWAAICYAAPGEVAMRGDVQPWMDPWPWDVDLDRRPSADASVERRIDGLTEAAALIVRELLRLRRKQRAIDEWLGQSTPEPDLDRSTPELEARIALRERTQGPQVGSVTQQAPRNGQRIRWKTGTSVWDLTVTGVCRDGGGELLAVYTSAKRWVSDTSPLVWPPPGVEIMDP